MKPIDKNRIKKDIIAWTKKYFIDLLAIVLLLIMFIKGIKANKLISIPIHTIKGVWEEIIKITPQIILIKNKEIVGNRIKLIKIGNNLVSQD